MPLHHPCFCFVYVSIAARCAKILLQWLKINKEIYQLPKSIINLCQPLLEMFLWINCISHIQPFYIFAFMLFSHNFLAVFSYCLQRLKYQKLKLGYFCQKFCKQRVSMAEREFWIWKNKVKILPRTLILRSINSHTCLLVIYPLKKHNIRPEDQCARKYNKLYYLSHLILSKQIY